MERQAIDLEKRDLAISLSGKRLVSRIYNKLLQLSNRKINNPIKTWVKRLNRHFITEYMKMTSKHMKMCSTSLDIRKIQIKTNITLL